MNLKKILFLALVPMLLAWSVTSHAANKAWFGFTTDLDISGVISPELERMTVTDVQPDSPAATAGLTIGDQIIEVNGTTLAGAPLVQMSDEMDSIGPGEHLLLKVERNGNSVVSIDIVAGSR